MARIFARIVYLLAGITVGGLVVALLASMQGLPIPLEVFGQPWVLVLLGGSYGGLLYGMRERSIELPHREAGNKYSMGFLADAMFGLAGGLVVFLLLPGNFDGVTTWESIKILATAMVGGYGGRAVIDKMLGQILDQVKAGQEKLERKTEDVEKRLATTENQASIDAKALSEVAALLDPPLDAPAVDQQLLNELVKKASPTVKVTIFQQAWKMRSDNWKKKRKKDMARTIPIFEALIASDTKGKYHRNHAQLGYALKDKEDPDWKGAEKKLSKAIEIRGNWKERGWLYYEMNRAICRIMDDENYEAGKPSAEDRKEAIQEDLSAATKWPEIKTIVHAHDDIKEWMKLNKVALANL